MPSRKAKEQQAATSSNGLKEIKDLLNANFSELDTRLRSLEEKLDNVTKDIHLKLNAVETTAQEASTYARENREYIEGLNDCNGTRTHNHLVRKRTLNHLASLAKWLSVRLRTKWLWVRIPLQSLNLQIWRLLRARSSLTFRQL